MLPPARAVLSTSSCSPDLTPLWGKGGPEWPHSEGGKAWGPTSGLREVSQKRGPHLPVTWHPPLGWIALVPHGEGGASGCLPALSSLSAEPARPFSRAAFL